MDLPRKEWLLCFDFDGTLIDPKKSQEIDPSLQKALSLIREKKVSQIYSQLQTGSQEGMNTLEQCLNNLYVSVNNYSQI